MIELDRLIHEPARLEVMALLSVLKEADFLYLLRETNLTKGNLSCHLAALEAAGYVEIDKSRRGKFSLTVVRLAPTGRTAFRNYSKHVNGILRLNS